MAERTITRADQPFTSRDNRQADGLIPKEELMSEKPWLAHYDEGVPKTLRPYPEITLIETLRETVKLKPEYPVLLFKGASMSAKTLEQLSNALGAALIAMGVKKGD